MERVGKLLKFGFALVLAFSLLAPFSLDVKANDPQTGTSTEHYEVRWDQPQLNDKNGYINIFSENLTTGERYVETFYWNIVASNDYYLPQIPTYMDIEIEQDCIRFNAKVGMELATSDNLDFRLTLIRFHGRGLSVIKSKECSSEEHTSFIYSDNGLDIDRKILGYYVYGNVGIVTDTLGNKKDNNFTVTYGVTADSNPYNIYVQMLELMSEMGEDISNIEKIIESKFDLAISVLDANINFRLLEIRNEINKVLAAITGKVQDINDKTSSMNNQADRISQLDSQLDTLTMNMGQVNEFFDSSILSEDNFLSNNSFILTASLVSGFIDNLVVSNDNYLLLLYSSMAFGLALMIIGKKV